MKRESSLAEEFQTKTVISIHRQTRRRRRIHPPHTLFSVKTHTPPSNFFSASLPTSQLSNSANSSFNLFNSASLRARLSVSSLTFLAVASCSSSRWDIVDSYSGREGWDEGRRAADFASARVADKARRVVWGMISYRSKGRRLGIPTRHLTSKILLYSIHHFCALRFILFHVFLSLSDFSNIRFGVDEWS